MSEKEISVSQPQGMGYCKQPGSLASDEVTAPAGSSLSGEYSIQALGYGNDKIENGQF
jgi:hypothetical protein